MKKLLLFGFIITLFTGAFAQDVNDEHVHAEYVKYQDVWLDFHNLQAPANDQSTYAVFEGNWEEVPGSYGSNNSATWEWFLDQDDATRDIVGVAKWYTSSHQYTGYYQVISRYNVYYFDLPLNGSYKHCTIEAGPLQKANYQEGK